MVPTWTGKPGKTGRHFPVREKSGNFDKLEQSWNFTQNTGKMRNLITWGNENVDRLFFLIFLSHYSQSAYLCILIKLKLLRLDTPRWIYQVTHLSLSQHGDQTSLHQLYLGDCKMPQDASVDVIKSLSAFKHLPTLDLDGSTLGDGGRHIADFIAS